MTHPRPSLSPLRSSRRRALVGAIFSATLAGLPQAASAQEVARRPEWAARVGASPNLFRVTPTLYRSAQLGKADVAELKALGIKNVVGLRAFHSDNDWLRHSGIKENRIKIYTWAVDDDNIVAALKAIRAAEQEGPVPLHCWHGEDRTGLVSAMYRLLYQGWNKAQALDELQNGGYGYHALWKNIPAYPSWAESPILQGGDAERRHRRCPLLLSISQTAD